MPAASMKPCRPADPRGQHRFQPHGNNAWPKVRARPRRHAGGGISHDLRAPLARLRLETGNECGRRRRPPTWPPTLLSWMPSSASSRLRAPTAKKLAPVVLADVVEGCICSTRNQGDVQIKVLEDNLLVLGDEIGAGPRAFQPAGTRETLQHEVPDTGIARIRLPPFPGQMGAHQRCVTTASAWHPTSTFAPWPAVLPGRSCAQAANGSGLGLPSCKTIERMGGNFGRGTEAPAA